MTHDTWDIALSLAQRCVAFITVCIIMKTRKPHSGGHLSSLIHRIFACLTALLIFIVSLGPIPKHVAFVMDGNRRYARGKGQKVREGHTEGFESLKRVSDTLHSIG